MSICGVAVFTENFDSWHPNSSSTMKLRCVLLSSAILGVTAWAPAQDRRPISRVSPLALAPMSMYIDITEETERDVSAMDEWASMCEVQRCDGFQLTSEDGYDYSAMTTEAISEGSPILCIPGNMILSSSRVADEVGNVSPAVDYLSRMGAGDQVPQFLLFVKIMAEYEQGDQSPYFPWLNSLPRLFYNSVSMTGKTRLDTYTRFYHTFGH